MSWFKKKGPPRGGDNEEERTVRTEGLFVKCPGCSQAIFKRELEDNLSVCPKCDHHVRLRAVDRLRMTFDNGQWKELDSKLESNDPLQFVDTKGYKLRLDQAKKATGLRDAVIAAEGTVGGHRAIVCSMELSFVGGSLGSVVGEKITRAIERCIETRACLIIFSASGGARMQEGALSLMQMAKISAALARLDDEGIPFVSILTDPTTGGVTASYAMLGDLNVAEPGALIGFAGPRVIEQTIRQKLPEGFQRAEFLVEHGMLDAVVKRKDLTEFVKSALDFMNRDVEQKNP